MSAFYRSISWALAVMSFLLSHHLDAFVTGCADKPIFSPSTLIVKYGDPASEECAVCPQACPTSNFNVEAPIGIVTRNGTNLSWSVDNMTQWRPGISCYYETVIGDHCTTMLPVTVYQPPTNISISTEQDSGRMLEDHEYTLQCAVQGVAPIDKLKVTFYRGQTPLGSQQLKENKQEKPYDHTYTHKINPRREDNGAQFWCEAKLELGDDGPQPPPVVESQKLTTSVYYKPKLKGPLQPAEIALTEGDRLHLSCLAEGNPSPAYTWTLPSPRPHTKSIDFLTIDSVTKGDEGEYKCLVKNDMGNVTVKYKVVVQGLTTTTLPPTTTKTPSPTTKTPSPTTEMASPTTRFPTTQILKNHSCRSTFTGGLMLFLFAVMLYCC